MRAGTGRWRRRAAATLLAGTLLAGQAGAAEMRQRYEVRISGLTAGVMDLVVDRAGDAYAARALLRSSGLVGFFSDFTFGGTARGTVLPDGSLRPWLYEGIRDNGKRTETVLSYDAGTPVSVRFSPPRKPRERDVPPRTQAGTLDPVSASFALLADAPAAAACNRSVEIYDGLRRSRITIGPRRAAEGGWVCAGTYSRVQGYSPKQMAEKVNFPFTLYYRESGGIMRVTRIVADTIIGSAVATRQ